MNFTNGTELHLGRTKRSKLMVRLFGIGGVFGILSWVIGASAKEWVGGISMLALAAGLLVFLLGVVAERKDLESKPKSDST